MQCFPGQFWTCTCTITCTSTQVYCSSCSVTAYVSSKSVLYSVSWTQERFENHQDVPWNIMSPLRSRFQRAAWGQCLDWRHLVCWFTPYLIWISYQYLIIWRLHVKPFRFLDSFENSENLAILDPRSQEAAADWSWVRRKTSSVRQLLLGPSSLCYLLDPGRHLLCEPCVSECVRSVRKSISHCQLKASCRVICIIWSFIKTKQNVYLQRIKVWEHNTKQQQAGSHLLLFSMFLYCLLILCTPWVTTFLKSLSR